LQFEVNFCSRENKFEQLKIKMLLLCQQDHDIQLHALLHKLSAEGRVEAGYTVQF